MSGAGLDAAQRAVLAALAEAIAPRSARMPSAGDLGLTGEGGPADRVLRLRPDLAPALELVLARAAESRLDPAAFLHRLQETDAAGLLALMQVVAGAYYMQPAVMAAIGYPGQEAGSLGRGEIGGEDLLAAMMERPPRWRRVLAAEGAKVDAGGRT